MKTYEISRTDFEVLDKMMNNVLGNRPKHILTVGEVARIDKLKDKFAGAFSCSLETEEE